MFLLRVLAACIMFLVGVVGLAVALVVWLVKSK